MIRLTPFLFSTNRRNPCYSIIDIHSKIHLDDDCLNKWSFDLLRRWLFNSCLMIRSQQLFKYQSSVTTRSTSMLSNKFIKYLWIYFKSSALRKRKENSILHWRKRQKHLKFSSIIEPAWDLVREKNLVQGLSRPQGVCSYVTESMIDENEVKRQRFVHDYDEYQSETNIFHFFITAIDLIELFIELNVVKF